MTLCFEKPLEILYTKYSRYLNHLEVSSAISNDNIAFNTSSTLNLNILNTDKLIYLIRIHFTTLIIQKQRIIMLLATQHF